MRSNLTTRAIRRRASSFNRRLEVMMEEVIGYYDFDEWEDASDATLSHMADRLDTILDTLVASDDWFETAVVDATTDFESGELVNKLTRTTVINALSVRDSDLKKFLKKCSFKKAMRDYNAGKSHAKHHLYDAVMDELCDFIYIVMRKKIRDTFKKSKAPEEWGTIS
jgi:hypothetical protein